MIDTVVGSYRVIRQLGKGGMGSVYLAEHTLLGRKAAIKVLRPELSARKEVVTRFFNEARAATAVNDAGIVQIFDFGYHSDGSAYIVMEYLEGESLYARIRRLRRLAVGEAMRLARQVATSVEAAHARRIVHRDLKPENIFIVPDAEAAAGERAKVLDFGIAKLSGDEASAVVTNTGAILGTPLYMAPEQCRGAGDVDHRADVYSLGCVMFHMITGRPPFEGDAAGDLIAAHLREPPSPPSALAAGVSPEIDALVLRCLAKDRDERFASMSELAAAISALVPAAATAVITPAPPPAVGVVGSMTATASGDGSTVGGLDSTAASGGRDGRDGRDAASPMPTTLGESAAAVAATAPRRRSWIAIGAVGAVGAGAALLLAVRGVGASDGARRGPADGGARGARGEVPPPDDDAAMAATRAPIDAAAAPAATAPLPDAAPAAPAPVIDAAPAPSPHRDAAPAPPAPRDAGPRRPPPHHPDAAPRDPLDLDGDGIPDIRP